MVPPRYQTVSYLIPGALTWFQQYLVGLEHYPY